MDIDKSFNECPVKINGDEKLKVKPTLDKVAGYIIQGWTILCVIMGIFSSYKHWDLEQLGGAFILWLIGSFILITILNFAYSFSPAYAKKKKEIAVIYDYFKKRFNILNYYNVDDYNVLDVVTLNAKNEEEAMFELYMRAYKLNADAIVLNSNTVSTNVSSDRIRGVTSTSRHNIIGTIIKSK